MWTARRSNFGTYCKPVRLIERAPSNTIISVEHVFSCTSLPFRNIGLPFPLWIIAHAHLDHIHNKHDTLFR
jgi:hypothetical protein